MKIEQDPLGIHTMNFVIKVNGWTVAGTDNENGIEYFISEVLHHENCRTLEVIHEGIRMFSWFRF